MKHLIFIYFAVLLVSMAHAKSKKTPAPTPPPPRVLKRIVEVGQITAPPIKVQSNLVFDFQFVANAQMYQVMANNTSFAVNFIQPQFLGDGTPAGMNAIDRKYYKVWRKNSVDDGKHLNTSIESLCMRYSPMFKVSGVVKSFEATDNNSFSFGFSPAGSFDVAGIDVNFKLKKSSLDVAVYALPAMSRVSERLYAENSAQETQKEKGWGISLNLGKFRLGPQFYHSTPLAQVTEKAFRKAITGLEQKVNALPHMTWFTRVVDIMDPHIIIMGGSDINIKVGDTFNVYNEETIWSGKACESAIIGSFKQSEPTAVIKIVDVADSIARGLIVEQSRTYDPVVGARVEIKQLAP